MTNEKLIESVRDIPTITRLSHVVQIEKIGELRDALIAAEKAHTPTDDEREAPTEQDWRAAHQDGGVIFAKVKGSPVPVLLMRGRYGDWSSETKRYRSADVEEVIKVYRWVPAGMQEAWSSEIVADFRRSEGPEPQGEPSDARRAPLQAVRGVGPKGTISWEEHLEAWNAYAALHGDRQSAERIAERGGFGHSEVRLLLGREPRTFRAGGVR